MRFQRLLMNTRRCLPSDHVATPRCTNPVPFGGWPARYALGSYDQNSAPVFASSATTRLYDVLRNSVSPIINGVAWKFPGRVRVSACGVSPVAHSHARVSWATFPRWMSASVEYFDAPRSPPQTGHSAPAWAFADRAANATTRINQPAMRVM